jgi:hypothetical protein
LSNVLPSMVFDLTLLETRLLIYAIKHKDFDYNLYNIYCPITYDNLKKTIHSLAKKVMSIYENEDQWSDMPILSYATYNRGKCAIGLIIAQKQR